MTEVRLRCTVCAYGEERPWTAVTWGERCPRCTTGRLLRAWPVAEDGGPRTPAEDYAESEVTGL